MTTTTLALALVPALVGLSNRPAPAGTLDWAERAFTAGVKARDDADTARAWFRESARAFDELWDNGHHAPALARNRARAHRLAGDLPRSIAAYHDGLAVARSDRTLQVELDDARAAVAYPLDGELAAECRPRPVRTVGTRMSPAEAYLAAGLLWVVVCLAAARYAMTRAPWLPPLAGAGLVGLAVLGGLWWYDWRQHTADAARPVVVVTADVPLKAGNGDLWPDRVKGKLPRGVEARALARRGGWVQVELAGGAVGWLPEAAVIAAGG